MKNSKQRILLLLFFCCHALLWGQTLEIHQIDVGAGDATLIRAQVAGREKPVAVLIDAGYKSRGQTVINYLKDPKKGNLGQDPYLDYIITSHYHADHIGGFVGSAKRKRGGCYSYEGILSADSGIRYYAVLDKGDDRREPSTPVYGDYKLLADSLGRRVTVGYEGNVTDFPEPPAPADPPHKPAPANMRLRIGGTIRLGVDANGVPITLKLIAANGYTLAPTGENPYAVLDAAGTNRDRPTTKKRNPNNWGLAWILQYGKFRYFTGGDIGGKRTGAYLDLETPLANSLPDILPTPPSAPGHICAMKANHHGSDDSNNAVFIQRLKPSFVGISCGRQHDHPKQPVLDRLELARWNAEELSRDRVFRYVTTELQYPRNIDADRGMTSGNEGFVVMREPDPDLEQSSCSMAPPDIPGTGGQGRLIQVNTAEAGQQPGNFIIKVYAQDNDGRRIDQRSVFRVSVNAYDRSGWNTSDWIPCHPR